MASRPNPLWDIPTRIFHWFVVVAVPLSWWSAETEKYWLHQWLGYTILVLVVSRISWGLVGSTHSRFADFLVGPGKVLAYLRGQGAASAGHNPLGGWSVITLLLLLMLQAVSGLFNSDDVFFSGPLYYAASTEFRDAMGLLHELAFNMLVAMVGLHILAVLYYQLRRRQPLLQAMLRGSAPGREGSSAPVPLWRFILVGVLAALLLWGLLALAPGPPPMMW